MEIMKSIENYDPSKVQILDKDRKALIKASKKTYPDKSFELDDDFASLLTINQFVQKVYDPNQPEILGGDG